MTSSPSVQDLKIPKQTTSLLPYLLWRWVICAALLIPNAIFPFSGVYVFLLPFVVVVIFVVIYFYEALVCLFKS